MKNANKFGAFAAMAAAVVVLCDGEALADAISVTGRVKVSGADAQYADIGKNADTAILQLDSLVQHPLGNSRWFGYTTTSKMPSVAYLLQGGRFYGPSTSNSMKVLGPFTCFRQTGGDFELQYILIDRYDPNYKDGASGEVTYPTKALFVFGGTGSAVMRGWGRAVGAATFAFNGPCNFLAGSDFRGRYNGLGDEHQHIWAFNGGVAAIEFSVGTTFGAYNMFFAFNGGERSPAMRNNTTERTEAMFGNNPTIVVYENGGGFRLLQGRYAMEPKDSVREPEGNVLWEIPIPENHVLLAEEGGMTFEYLPQVKIIDEPGTNAEAVADWDWDTMRVTNITVLCRGERFSSSAKATLTDAAGNDLLGESNWLDCTVRACPPSDHFTYAATNSGARIELHSVTNWAHGNLVIDMDASGLADYGANTTDVGGNTQGNEFNIMFGDNSYKAWFPNITNIILKSGCFASAGYGFQTKSKEKDTFPNCDRMEIYGGHMRGGDIAVKDVVIGGTLYLCGHALVNDGATAKVSAIKISDNGTLTVDVSKSLNGRDGMSVIKYGGFNGHDGLAFGTDVTIGVDSLDALPKGWTGVILDCSETTVSGTPTVIQPEGGYIRWDAEEQKLYAHRYADGLILIVK